MGRLAKKQETLARRKMRVRGIVSGTEERPRLAVSRSLRHLRVQVINDVVGRTLAAASTQEKDVMGDQFGHANIEAAKLVGKAIAERALAAGVTKVVFDRAGRPYHGRIKALADAAREAGLQF